MKEPSFDIFSGVPSGNPMWLETVVGLSNARERMEQIAAKKPGQYFVFSIGTHSPVTQIETFQTPEGAKAQTA
jgi:hypothetical protein